MQIRPTAFTIGLIIYSFITLFAVYTEFGIDSEYGSGSSFVAIPVSDDGNFSDSRCVAAQCNSRSYVTYLVFVVHCQLPVFVYSMRLGC